MLYWSNVELALETRLPAMYIGIGVNFVCCRGRESGGGRMYPASGIGIRLSNARPKWASIQKVISIAKVGLDGGEEAFYI